MGRHKRLMATMAVVLLVGACGGSKASEEKTAEDGGQAEVPTSSTVEGGDDDEAAAVGKGSTATTQKASGGGSSKSAGSSTADGSGGGGGNGSTATTEKPKEPLPLEASLKSSCVKAGGQQTITIKVPPGSGAGYNSYYPDGKTATMEGFYGGNNGKVVENEDGTWSDTWVITANAPAGKVRVAVLAGHMDYEPVERDLFFDLVPATGTCP